MSTLSDLLPAGSGGKNVDFVASGSLPNGQTVGLKSDGTVEAITGNAAFISSPCVFDSNGQRADPPAIFFDPASNKVVLSYADFSNGGYATSIVGTVSGTTITFTTPALVLNSHSSHRFSSAYDPDTGRGVVAYLRGDYPNYGIEVVVLTGIGSTLTKGGLVQVTTPSGTIATGYHNYITMSYNTSANKILITYAKGGDSGGEIRGIVCTVNGGGTNTVTPAAIDGVLIEGSNYAPGNWAFHNYNTTTSSHLIAYIDSSTNLTAKVLTISGTTLTINTAVNSPNSGRIQNNVVQVTGTSNFIVTCEAADTSINVYMVAVSGSSITWQNSVVIDINSDRPVASYNPDSNTVAIFFQQNNDGYVRYGNISGSTITFPDAKVRIDSTSSHSGVFTFPAAIYDTNVKRHVVMGKSTPNNAGVAYALINGSTNNTSFIGIADAAIANSATGSVTIKGGIATNASLPTLTPNSVYYLQSDGTISTTSTSPAVRIGKALSSTSINLEFNS